ncbi:MAG: 50S ribosomal protein L10 [Actinomycetia bacterium]|nr:50S ribosomal protein L10 [Actinomycetes bacterium]MCP3910252.1 50S ribosomal protein L10 [Actinomycetes bacterium]MCP4087671.1 50S ribosomal protein L10 [Actinomycetes bacterium]
MENPRPEKVAIVDEVRERFSSAEAAVLTEYRGLDVPAMSDLRRQIGEAGASYKIYKNRLVKRAAAELEIEIDDLLVGPTAIAFVDGGGEGPADPVPLAKVLKKFASENENLVVKGGLLGDVRLTVDEINSLADVAPREELLARLAGGLAAPMVRFAGLLQALPQNFAYALQALIEQGGGVDAPAPAEEAPAGEGGEDIDGAQAATEDSNDEGSAPDGEAEDSNDNEGPAEGGDDTAGEDAGDE